MMVAQATLLVRADSLQWNMLAVELLQYAEAL